MKSSVLFLRRLVVCLAGATATHAQNLSIPNISDGRHLAFNPQASTNVTLPDDGRLQFTSVNIPVGVTVTFTRNAANTPVYLLAQQGITNRGTIDVSAGAGTTSRGGFGGPGGYDGGNPGAFGSQPGDGLGPGAGRGGATPGKAAFGGAPANAANPLNGRPYGSPFLVPLVGGSGGGGSLTAGGGGGGGAILLASSTHIENAGTIQSLGSFTGGTGSGGAIRLLAPRLTGTGQLNVTGWASPDGPGRISCEMIDRSGFAMSLTPPGPWINTTNFLPYVDLPTLPRLRIVSVGGMILPANSPAGALVNLPPGSAPIQPIVIEATGFGSTMDVELQVTPSHGPALPVVVGQIDNSQNNPATGTLSVSLPANVPLTINAWTTR